MGDFGWVQDIEVDYVVVFFSCCVVIVVIVVSFYVVCYNRWFFIGVGYDLMQWCFYCVQCNFDIDVLIFVLIGQVSEFCCNVNQCYVVVSYYVFFNCSMGCVQGVVDVCFFFFYFNFGSCIDFDYCYVVSQFSDMFLQFFMIVVGGCFFDLFMDLSYVVLDCGFFVNVIDDGGGVFVDNYVFCLVQVFQSCFFQFYIDFFRDNGIVSQSSDVLQYSFMMVVEVWCFYCSYFNDVVYGVNYQGCQCFVFNVFSDDDQWFVSFCYGFQNWQYFVDVGDFFVSQQDEWVFQFNGIGVWFVDEVWRQVVVVELYIFNYVQFVFQIGIVFNGDYVFFINFIYCFCDQFINGFVGVSGDGIYLSDSFGVRVWNGQCFQFFYCSQYCFVDIVFQIYWVYVCSNSFQIFVYDSLSQYGCGGGVVVCCVVCFRGNFFYYLCVYVFEFVFQFDFMCNGNIIFGDGWCVEGFVQNYVMVFWVQGYFNCICQYVYVVQYFYMSVVIEFYVFCCYFFYFLNLFRVV